jgi:oligopeptide transport system substrate-binding protein
MSTLLLSAVLISTEPTPVRIQMLHGPSSLDPDRLDDTQGYRIVFDLFEGLVVQSASGAIEPGAARAWETTTDGLVWTFYLRPDAVWSDGSPLTADDFVYSFRRALDPATACPSVLALMPILSAGEIASGQERDLTKLGVMALDPHTLRIRLTRPAPWFLDLLTNQVALPVPRQAIQVWGDRWTRVEHIVTNGPFTLKKWMPLSEIDLTRNPQFHNAPSVKIEEIDYVLTGNSNAALERHETGELNAIRMLGTAELPRLKRGRPDELHSRWSAGPASVQASGSVRLEPRYRGAF